MGSKARFAKELLPIILKDRKADQWYIEPFCGGCNMIDKVDGNRLANDSNKYLISMWEKLLYENWIPKEITREEYIKIKNNKGNYPPHLIGWVGFNCSYSGKYFGGFAGKTKTKLGTIRDYQKEALKNVLKQLEFLNNVVFSTCSFNSLKIPINSIIYCDPPYEGTTKYKDSFDNELFWDWVRKISNNGHIVYVSEYNAPSDFKCVWNKKVKSSLSANGAVGGNKESIEKLFTLNRSLGS